MRIRPLYILVSCLVFMATDFVSSSFFAYSYYVYFSTSSSSFVFGLCSKLQDLVFRIQVPVGRSLCVR